MSDLNVLYSIALCGFYILTYFLRMQIVSNINPVGYIQCNSNFDGFLENICMQVCYVWLCVYNAIVLTKLA